jgi:GNAT superfamily N-acetyltransferase
MPDLRLIPSTELPRELKCQILSFIRVEWWWIFRDHDRFWDYTHKSTHPVNVVITERGQVISHAEVNWRLVEHAGASYKVYGVSAVFTFPAFRQEGYGTQVIRAATDFIRGSDADVAMLFCLPQLVPFYEHVGWEAPPNAQILYGDQDYPHEEEIATCMLFVSERGQAAREAFSTRPVYVGGHTW